jgi:hypothetical protein
MVNIYKGYIEKFIINCKENGLLGSNAVHFVTSYLRPKIEKTTKNLPRMIINDFNYCEIIYDENNVSIIVQTEKIRFTKTYYNEWIKNNDNNCKKYYICINKNGLFLQDFLKFKRNYILILENQKKINFKSYEIKKYSPSVNMENYLYYCILNGCELKNDEYFYINDNKEKLFEKRLKMIFGM